MINKELKIILSVGITLTALATAICAFFNPACCIVAFLLGATITGLYFFSTKKRYNRLNELNNYLSAVCSGNYDLKISENTEGELSILSNNLFKVITILKNQNEILQRDKVYLADSLADISHQLKTPLTSLMVITDLLRDDMQPEKRNEFIAIIENQLDKMKWLITNLLKLSRLDADTVEFKKEGFSVKEAISDSLRPFSVILELKEIEIIENCDDFIITGDNTWTAEAIGNIIKNCIEHTDKKGSIAISSVSTNIYNSLIIKDNGCGINDKDLPHIFDRFYHGENSSSDSVGIGLALAKTIFEKENAAITVKSEIGVGTEFEIKFYNAII